MPPTIPFNHYFDPRNQRNIEPKSYSVIPCCSIHASFFGCFEHPNLFKVNEWELHTDRQYTRETYTVLPYQCFFLSRRPVKSSGEHPIGENEQTSTDLDGRLVTVQFRNPTTSFLTATTLVYAIRAGITAAAGQWYRGLVFFLHAMSISSLA
jgi:hypothetical protein